MIPFSFEYKKAASVKEAISMLDGDAKILGGGHSLIPTLKLRLDSPACLIDISKIESLQHIRDNDNSISIGAGVTHAQIAEDKSLATHCPMMGQAAKEIGDIQVRNRGTLGGSIAHADPAADWPAVLLAANAQVTIQNSNGTRTVDIDQFFKGFFETALEEGEIITTITVPKTMANQNSAYVKFKQPASRFAIVGCAVALAMNGSTIESARIGLTGVADVTYRPDNVEKALIGEDLNEASIDKSVQDVTDGVSVMSDHYASESYRKHLAQVFVKRALKKLM
ncbi:MAG: xanthine dehydrogenase family protein subunit M [Flavobacteriaceae bacterium]|nr:xanthine dehydrogenase family protein subunit M [Flavobacteriaceae bacterium]MDH3796353.1 xanthine dehydrogenase family protein subunit M [Flavobacteriaceae bacterium]